jgi:hypothetical protein
VAERIETPVVTVPAGTLITAPQTTALSLRDAVLQRIEVVIPPGPSGLMGFAFLHSGQQIIPFNTAQWIIADDDKLSWDVDNYPTGNKWSVRAYNTDVYAHSLYLRLHFQELRQALQLAGEPILIVPVIPDSDLT